MRTLAAVSACMFCIAAGAATGNSPRIAYTKTFRGSTPAFVSISVERSGQVVYKEAVDDPDPLQFQLSGPDTEALFGMADKLAHFARPLESGLKVAQMGIKTFRYESGTETHEAKFNYSEDPDARTLADWFERIVETERNYIVLDQATHFDKLGVNEALLQLETTYDHKRLVSPSQFLPLLERVAKNDSFLHMARERAARLADTFRKPGEEKTSQ